MRLEVGVVPIKGKDKELKRHKSTLKFCTDGIWQSSTSKSTEIKTLNTRLDKSEKPKEDSYNDGMPPSQGIHRFFGEQEAYETTTRTFGKIVRRSART